MNAVTIDAKRYVYVCAGCDLLADSGRSDSLTCSSGCRVLAHRNGRLKALHGRAKSFDIHPSIILQAKAIDRLRPDLALRVLAGSMTMFDAQRQIWPAFWSLVEKAAQT